MNILDYLERAASLYPAKIAVDDSRCTYTWTELVVQAKKIGSLFTKMTQPDRPIMILMEKSSLTLAAMFGAVYAGCFYTMVDPSQPAQRMQEILKVLDPSFVVVNDKTVESLTKTGYKGTILNIAETETAMIDEAALAARRGDINEETVLYGIFTSGSTGTPKGIIVNHGSVIDFIGHFVETFGFTREDRFANQAPFDFDVSVKDIYSCIFTGATLVLVPKEMFSTPPVLLDYLCEKQATTLVWAVSALTLVTALKGLSYRVPEQVKNILFSGEVMPLKHLKKWMSALPETRFVNLYGPSEITCNCTYYPVTQIPEADAKLPIGSAFAGREVFLLDENDQVVTAPGEIGEICSAGESLAVGYYHNPEETAKRFVTFAGKRCYKTGDLGFFGEDGLLYFSGRKDFQIKHMGHRIELEEIEGAMEQIPGVERALCLMDEKRNRLAGFFMGDVTETTIREQMKEKVPVYMIPHKLIQTAEMPLNKNGKTDRSYFKAQLG